MIEIEEFAENRPISETAETSLPTRGRNELDNGEFPRCRMFNGKSCVENLRGYSLTRIGAHGTRVRELTDKCGIFLDIPKDDFPNSS